MREYAKISPLFWIGRTGRMLRSHGPQAQLLALYLVSCPHSNMLGLYYLPKLYMAQETGLNEDETNAALQQCIDTGFCAYDDDSEMVWVREMARFQIGERLFAADKRCKGIASDLAKLPASRLVLAFIAKYRPAYHISDEEGPSKGLPDPIDGPPKPGARTGTEAGTGIKQNASAVEASLAQLQSGCACPHEEIIDAYHRLLPTARKVRVWNETRKAKLRARWREDSKRQNIEWWERFFSYIAESDFLTGKTNTPGRQPFEVDLEWIVTPSNFIKIIEGKYHPGESA